MSHNVWFTSDTHFGHANVIRYSNRPWSMVNEMNDGIIERWNSRIKPGDTVYHLGDFCLTKRVDVIDEWLGRLNGEIRLIRGNHDQWTKRYERLENKGKIKWIRDYAERTFEVDGARHKLILCHFPLLFWHNSHHGSIMLHGHCHGNAQHHNTGVRRMDVGVDCNSWYPVLLENVITLMENVPLNPHHERHD
jgi:calcineurin-like phosphoesterase family protein